jgi:threonine dehydrogenase-like Zn-dependent dehydrogenase
VVFEATGVPALVQTAVELVAQAGRVVVVGLSSDPAAIRVGALPLKEIDVLGVSCSGADELAQAVDLVGRLREAAARLVTHEFHLERAPEAIAYAMGASCRSDEGIRAARPGSGVMVPARNLRIIAA